MSEGRDFWVIGRISREIHTAENLIFSFRSEALSGREPTHGLDPKKGFIFWGILIIKNQKGTGVVRIAFFPLLYPVGRIAYSVYVLDMPRSNIDNKVHKKD